MKLKKFKARVVSFILVEITQAEHIYDTQWAQTRYYGEDNHMSIGWTPDYAYDYKWI
ncbi:hypothetical protein [Clostridium peptidivorans]|uniref:hypothetical protein n=1 Tax=Clostridium peptidivorans TaxID=100174 RepID=UPI0015CDECF2|nr:hypothetical protein [Clostridium peptidivorans]